MSETEMPAVVIHTHAVPPTYRLRPLPRRENGQALVQVMTYPYR